MKLHHAFLLALGIATPLWLRQQLLERDLRRHLHISRDELERYLTQHHKELEGVLGGYQRWSEKLVKQINREMSQAGARRQ